jgi:septal ring factor EnvC (AmiA/AmiB activator)
LKEIKMADKTVSSLSKKLERYQELEGKHAELEEMLTRAESEKGSVKHSIYQKVCKEYQSELDEVNKELKPLQTEIDGSQKAWAEELRDTEVKAKHVQEKLEEFEFRYRVGEYSESQFSKVETPLKKQLEDLFKTSSDLRARLEQIEAAKAGVLSSTSEGSTLSAAGSDKSPTKSSAKPTSPSPMPAERPGSSTKTESTDKVTDSTTKTAPTEKTTDSTPTRRPRRRRPRRPPTRRPRRRRPRRPPTRRPRPPKNRSILRQKRRQRAPNQSSRRRRPSLTN